MKKLSLIVVAMLMLFSSRAFAGDKYTKEMLKQVADVNSAWKPIIGTNKQVIRREHDVIYILSFYNTFKHGTEGLEEGDPEHEDIKVLFQVKDGKCKLLFIYNYLGPDLIKDNLDTLVP